MHVIRCLGLALLLLLGSPALAGADLDTLFAKLRDPATSSADAPIEPQIWAAWMEAGTPAQNDALIRAAASMNLGSYAEALAQLDALLATADNFAEAWNKRATLFFLMGRFDESLADIVKTLELEPRHFGALSGRGMIFQRLGKEAEALAAYKEALSINPHMGSVRLAIQQLERRLPEL